MASKYDRRLRHVAVLFTLLAIGNAIDFILPGEKNFKKINGTITYVSIEPVSRKTKRNRPDATYIKVSIELNNKDKQYYVTEHDGLDSSLANLQKGDVVELLGKYWYHLFFYAPVDANFYQVRKNGVVVFDILYKCRQANKIFMIAFGIVGLLFWVIYLDVVKGISLENWFQKKIVKNKDYLHK